MQKNHQPRRLFIIFSPSFTRNSCERNQLKRKRSLTFAECHLHKFGKIKTQWGHECQQQEKTSQLHANSETDIYCETATQSSFPRTILKFCSRLILRPPRKICTNNNLPLSHDSERLLRDVKYFCFCYQTSVTFCQTAIFPDTFSGTEMWVHPRQGYFPDRGTPQAGVHSRHRVQSRHKVHTPQTQGTPQTQSTPQTQGTPQTGIHPGQGYTPYRGTP